MKNTKLVLVLLIVFAILVTACQPQVIEKIVTQQVVVTQEVEKQVVVTQEVEKQVLVTPTAPPSGPAKLTVWSYLIPDTYPQPMDLVNSVIAKFKTDNPGTSVDWVSIPYESSDAKLTSAFASRTNAPDIWHGKVPYFAGGLGVADPAPDYVAKCWDANAVDPIKPYLKYNGQYYGFPVETDLGMMLYYNKDMFKAAGLDPEKPPTTMDELLADAQKLTKPDGSQIGFAVRYNGNPRGIADKWIPFLHAWGGRLYSEDGTKADGFLNSKEAIASLQFYGDLVNKYKVSDLAVGKPEDAFVAKRAAMLFREAFMVGLLRDSAPDINYGVVHLPMQTVSPGLSLLFQDAYMVYKFSPNKDLAWKLVYNLTCDENFSLQQAKLIGALPTYKDLFYTNSYITQRPDYKIELSIIENPGSPYYGHPYINEISFRVGQAVEEVLFGQKTAEQALNDAVPDVEAILVKGKE